jgi:DNA-binding NarL/FixJ family response regulator
LNVVPKSKMPLAPVYRVFVVEDSPVIRETLASSLESAGLVKIVGFAETPDDAWRVLHLQQADAVIIDLNLRAGTGFDLLTKLRNAPELGHLLKVVLTNYARPAFRQRCIALGADYFFDKSLEFDQALDVLDDRARRGSASPAS